MSQETLVILFAEKDPAAVVSGQTVLDPAPIYWSVHGTHAPPGASLPDGTDISNIAFQPLLSSVTLPARNAFRPGSLGGKRQPGTFEVDFVHNGEAMILRDRHWYQRRLVAVQGPAAAPGEPVRWSEFNVVFDGLADAVDLQPTSGRLEARHLADVALAESPQSAGGFVYDGFGHSLDVAGRGYLRVAGDAAALETDEQTLQFQLFVESRPQAAELMNVDDSNGAYLRIKPDGALRFDFTGTPVDSPAGAVPLGQWVTLTARRTPVTGGYEVQLFVGATPLLGSMVVGGSVTATGADLFIGVRTPDEPAGPGSDYNRALRGSLREIRVWNVALSDTQIAENHAKPARGDEAGLVALWSLNDVDATDAQGNPATYDEVTTREALIVDEATWGNPGLGGPELAGEPMPFAVGEVWGMEPQLVDPLNGTYRYHAREAGGIFGATGGGVVLSKNGENPDYTDFPELGLLQLHNPVQHLRINFDGDAVGGFVNSPSECAARLASLAGLSCELTILHSSLETVGYVDRVGKPLSEGVATLLGSVRASALPHPDASSGYDVLFRQIQEPPLASTVRRLYAVEDIRLIHAAPDSGRPVLRWGRTWDPLSADQLLGGADDAEARRLLAEWRTLAEALPAWQVGTAPPAEPYDTAFTRDSAAATEAELRAWLHDGRAWHMQLTACVEDDDALEGDAAEFHALEVSRWWWLPDQRLVVLSAQPLAGGRWALELYGGL